MLNFNLKNVDQSWISLDEYKNAPAIVIIFTCNHCPYAIAYEERIKDLDKKYRPLGVPLIAISSNNPITYPQDSFENMIIRAREKDFGFPYVFDGSQEIAHAYKAERTPHAYLLKPMDDDFEIIYKGAIDDNYRDASQVKEHYLADKIDAVLAGEDLSYSETAAIGCTIKWK